MVKKLFAIILTICMVITMLPQIAFMAVQYPQEVTVFDSAVSGFERQTFDYGNSDYGDATIKDGTVISNINGSGFQFKANDKFAEAVKNGAIITVSMNLVFGEDASVGQMLLTRYKDNDDATKTKSAILLEYYNNTKALRAFSTNCYLKQNVTDIAEKMKCVISRNTYSKDMIEKSRKIIDEEYSIACWVKNMLKQYGE